MKSKYVTKQDADAKAFSTKYTRDIYVLKTKIAHVEDKIHITEIDKEKLKKLEKEKISKIEEEKQNIELNIDNTFAELNSKKEKIYLEQKKNLEKFKDELKKLTDIYEKNEQKNLESKKEEDEINEKKSLLQKRADEYKENYEKIKQEMNELKSEAQNRLKTLDELKEKYPKEYEYFQEKFKYLKKINELKQDNINIEKEISNLEKNINDSINIKNEKNVIGKKYLTEKVRNDSKIEELKSGIALEQLENDLQKHNSDIFSWNYIKEIMIQYYGEKYYNEKKRDYIDNLRDLWTNRINYIFNEEYLRTKRAKESKLEILLNRLSELELNNKKASEESNQLNEESEMLKEELNIDENDFNKVYTIFNDVILLLNNINEENEDEIFDQHFINVIISINPEYSNMKEYDKNNFDRLIQLYIQELIEHSKSKKNLVMRNIKCEEFIEEHNNENKTIENEINEKNKKIEDLQNKKVKNTEEISKIKNIIEVKTTEMKKYLNEICEEKFQTYKEENSEVLKNFNKIYGKKILTKANKVQKEKIYEDRINEHIKMKDLMENMTKYINEYNIKNKELNEKIIEQTNEYDKIMTQVDEINFNLEEKNLKNKSEREAHEKLKNEIDNKVKEQSIKLKTEKEKLEKKENLDFYIEKIKKLNNDLKNIEKKKEKIFEQFSLFFQQVQEEQLKLQEQSHQLKLQLLEFKSIEDENAFGSKVRNNNDNEINNNNEEEKNNEEQNYLMNQRKEEYLNQKKSENRLEIPENEDIFAEHMGYMNTADVEIYDIDMFNENIKPLFEGVKVYKRFTEKAVKTEYEEYDPIKNKNTIPEAYDYALRKLYANIKEKQFEFFTLDGIPKIEAMLKFEQILGIKYSDNAKKIIKIKNSKLRTGNRNDFIAKDNIPFSIMTKNNNWDIVCPEYTTYLAIKTMIDSILAQPKVKKNIFEDIEIEKKEHEENYEEYEE